MGSIIQANAMIQEGVDEFKLAAAKTATGIIEQGLAVLKIKQGCAQKQGGSDYVCPEPSPPLTATISLL